jgi:glycosidase
MAPRKSSFVLALVAICHACDPSLGSDAPPQGAAPDGGSVTAPPGPAGDAATSDAPAPDAGVVPCATTFRFAAAAKDVKVAGEWDGFTKPLPMQGPDAQGAFTASVDLVPGLWAYKLVVDGQWQLDAEAPLRKYHGGVENSAVRVTDCRAPSLALTQKSVARPAAGQGRFTAAVRFARGSEKADIEPSSLAATLRRDGARTAVAGMTLSGDAIALDVGGLADGKYTVVVTASDKAGRAAKPLRLVFWIESAPFEWKDALIYMVMIDRFKNGDASNDATPTAGVDPRADFKGGDLQGVRAAIASGALDQLGVRAIWLSPFHTNPPGKWIADNGAAQVMGYHGYWPTKARDVEPRIGGKAALEALVAEAHAHGIRVLQDFVVNHIHQDHEYFTKHPSWFRTGCTCGTSSCGWTEKRLECLFSSYMPDVDWSNTDASEQFVDDAAWWIDAFDLDGLRIDAVKHVEDAAVMNLAHRVRTDFEAAGTRVFLTGETAMGWNDCGLACNAGEYGTISRYVGSRGLDGQFDFVLHHAVPYRVFAYGDKGMLHADYWTQQSQSQYPAGAIMTPYIGSQDTPRFATLAHYRGQPGRDRGVASNKWTDVASGPPDAEAYARHRLALAWLLTIPGAPMLYYGDEYGEWGGADPNNRVMWRGDGALSTEEQATLVRTRALGQARRELAALRRGGYTSLHATEDVLVFARQAGSSVAIVGLNRGAAPASVQVALPASLGLAGGATLSDRLGGPSVTVSGANVTLQLAARGAAVLAP